jgi:hypothetical protein
MFRKDIVLHSNENNIIQTPLGEKELSRIYLYFLYEDLEEVPHGDGIRIRIKNKQITTKRLFKRIKNRRIYITYEFNKKLHRTAENYINTLEEAEALVNHFKKDPHFDITEASRILYIDSYEKNKN